MARTYKHPQCEYTVEGGHIISNGDIRHKISGTSMAGILGVSPWSTPFQVACNLLGLCREDISNKPAVTVGNELEPVIIGFLADTYADTGLFLPAEQVYEKREGDHDAWVSDFQDEVFAGHVDGIVIRDDGDYILEIKTSINMDSWADGVPEYYYWQVALYNEMITQKDKAFVGLGIVNSNTYKDPSCWVPNERTVGLFEMQIDREQVREGMERARAWYEEYIMQGRTPDHDPNNQGDVEMYNHLLGLTASIDKVRADVARLSEVITAINATEKSIDALYLEKDALKSSISEYMDVHNLSTLDTEDGRFVASLVKTTRKSLDKAKLKKDGVDVDKYMVEMTSNTFRTKFKGE